MNLRSRGQYQKESTERNVSSPVVISLFLLFSPQLNISFPATGCQKLIEVDDERKLRTFYEKRMATEVAADPLGDEWKVRLFTFPHLHSHFNQLLHTSVCVSPEACRSLCSRPSSLSPAVTALLIPSPFLLNRSVMYFVVSECLHFSAV